MVDGSPLGYLVGAYLNEDVFDFYPDVMTAVDDFVRSDPEMTDELAAEIDQVLRTKSDEDIEDLLSDYGIGFIPGELGYRDWLVKIAERVRAVTGSNRPAS